MTLKMILREQEVEIINIEFSGAAPSVGISRPVLESYDLEDSEGNPLNWEITDEEDDQITEEIYKAEIDQLEDDWDCDTGEE